MTDSSDPVARPQLLVCLFPNSTALAQTLQQRLDRDRYLVKLPTTEEEFYQVIEQHKQHIDCLVLQSGISLPRLVNWLHQQATLLPAVILSEAEDSDFVSSYLTSSEALTFLYHSAEVRSAIAEIEQLPDCIDHAIEAFLDLSPSCLVPRASDEPDLTRDLTTQNFLMLQQRRLTQKLKERLGYLGIYYKRNPKNFLRHLPLEEREQLLDQLRTDYRQIILEYFTDSPTLNQKIDNFVTTAFFADVSVSQLVEAHMEIMDAFSKQLKLEGRSEEVLLDYRLTLIDTIAHLCEMYRRSIPRES